LEVANANPRASGVGLAPPKVKPIYGFRWDSVGYSENTIELERTVSWSMVGLQIGNTKEFKVAKFVLVWLKTDSTERERE
jgi:hypothetical protein